MVRVLKYNEAKLKITQLIQQNQLRPGDKLASERELANQLGMSIISVRRALAEFQDAGIVRKVSGIGSFYNGNLALESCSSRVAVVNIGDSLYPDSPTICLFEQALEKYHASHKVFHVKRDVEPEVLNELRGFDKIAVTGYINTSWIECLSSLGKPLLQIGESQQPNSLAKVKGDWEDVFRIIFKRFGEIDRQAMAFLLPDLVMSTYGALLRELIHQTARREGSTVNEALLVHVPLETAIGTVNELILRYADKIRLLVIETGSLLPFLLAPAHRLLPHDLPIVVVQELMNLPMDIGRLENFHCVAFEENILTRSVHLFYEKPYSFFAENQTEFVSARFIETVNNTF